MKSKEAAIKAEQKRLTEIFEEIPENKKKLVAKLIDNAAFMAATLEELQDNINKGGAVFTSKNGNGFEIVQEHPAQKSYNIMVGKYATIIKQLESMLPSSEVTAPGAELMKFLSQDDT